MTARRICANIYIHSRHGGQSAAEHVHAHRSRRPIPLAVNHQGQFPVVTVSFNLAPGASLGDAVEAIDSAKDELEPAAQHSGGFQGRPRRSRPR